MLLRQLEFVDAVARTGSFSRAAEALHVAQPAVSVQVAKLERELGVRLFDRTTRRVTTTPACEVLLSRARRAFAELDAVGADLAELRDVVTGVVTIGVSVAGPIDIPRAIATFRRDHPLVEVRLRTGLVRRLHEQLAEGVLDLVVGPVPTERSARFASTVLAEERVVLAVAPGSTHRSRRLATYAHEPFISLPRGSGLHTILVDAGRAAGFEPNVAMEAATSYDIRSLVTEGLGVALLAGSNAERPGPEIRVIELQRAPTHPPIALTARAATSTAAVARFRQLLEGT